MKPRTESTAKTGARLCEFWGGRGDCSGIYLYCVGICRLAHVGATIVLVDSQKDNVEMDYDKLADAITERTKVIVPVNIAGICADVDKVREIVNRPEILAKFHPANDIQKLLGRIAISNDCAHSFGASRHGKMAGEIADFSSFSFHAVKNFTTAEGGALTWNLPFGNEKVERQQVYCGSPVPFIEGESWNEFIYRLSQLFRPRTTTARRPCGLPRPNSRSADASARNPARRTTPPSYRRRSRTGRTPSRGPQGHCGPCAGIASLLQSLLTGEQGHRSMAVVPE